ncbi:MAG: hypothetical protein IIB25_07130, partial [Chloroflexi bacterium]|nr:hypothetical protein [Chloroflexota bacterium]
PGVFGASGLAEVNCALIHVEGGIGLSTGQVAEAAAAIRARTGHLAESHVSSVREVAMGRRIRVTLVLAARGPTAELKPGPTLKKMARSTSDRNSIWPNGLQKPATVSEDLEIQRPVRRRGPMLLPVS